MYIITYKWKFEDIIISANILTKHSDTLVSEAIIVINHQCPPRRRRGSIDRCGAIHARNEKRASGRIDLAGGGRGSIRAHNTATRIQLRQTAFFGPGNLLFDTINLWFHSGLVHTYTHTHTYTHIHVYVRAQTRTHYNKTAACLIE